MSKKWLTPDSASGQTTYTLSCPDSLDFLSALLGAIELLTDENNWEVYGTATPQECADLFLDALIWDIDNSVP
jgi:hypothetical protein